MNKSISSKFSIIKNINHRLSINDCIKQDKTKKIFR